MIQDDDWHDEIPPRADKTPSAPTSGVRVYDRPARTLPPVWLLILVALLVVAGIWLAFTYL